MRLKTNFLPRKNLSLILLFAIVLIPLLTLGYFLFYDNMVLRHKEEAKKNQQIAELIARDLDGYIYHVKTSLSSMAAMDPVRSGDRKKIEEMFSNLKLGEEEISLYWAVGPTGNLLAKFPKVGPDSSAAGKQFFIESMQGKTFVSDRITGDITGKEIIVISVPFYDKQGRVAGVLGASVPLEQLQQKLKFKVGNSGYPILVSKSGKFLAHPKLEEIRNKVQIGDPIWNKILQGNASSFEAVAPFDNQKKIFSYVPLEEANWIVVVIQPLTELEAQLNSLFTRNFLVIFLLLLVVGLAAYQLVLTRNREEEARIAKAEKLAAVGQMAAGMAHEIRNPLTSIKGFVQMTYQREECNVPPHYLETILQEIERIDAIIGETLLLSKPASTQFLPVNVSDVAREVCTLMEPQAMLNNIKLTLNTKDLPLVMGERNQLKQTLINLIKNSIEAISDGGKIAVELTQQSNFILVSVADTGCGIPAHLIEKLGSPFMTTKETGTGLGLTVTYQIIQNHGGTIQVKSSPSGTTFIISLPIITV